MISVNGVVQEPDPTGNAGFKLLGSNIVFSSAPANGHAFFGVINAGADYVTAGSEFPDGSATAPSFTFQDDQDTGWFRSGSGAVGYSANGVQTLTFDGNGLTVTGDASFVGDSSKNLLWDKSDGALEFADNAKAVFGTGSDLQIYHNGTDSYIKNTTGDTYITGSASSGVSKWLYIRAKSDEQSIICKDNGAVELYHNNVKKFETSAAGVVITGVTASDPTTTIYHSNADVIGEAIRFGRTDLPNIRYHSIKAEHSGGSASNMLQFHIHNGSNTTSQTEVLELTGDGKVHVNDNIKFECGTGDDLQIYHDGSNSYLNHNGGGDLWIQAQGADENLWLRAKDDVYIQTNDNENAAKFLKNGAVELYYDNSKTLETINGGATVTGQLYVTAELNLINGTTNQSRYIDTGLGDGNTLFIRGCSGGDANHETLAQFTRNGACTLFHDASARIATTAAGVTVTGAVSDSKGDLRKIPSQPESSAHTPSTAHVGYVIYISSGGVTFNNNTFNAGDVITVVNNSGSDQTITQGSGLTIYNAADAATGNRTLAGRGMATIWFAGASTAYISGAGLS